MPGAPRVALLLALAAGCATPEPAEVATPAAPRFAARDGWQERAPASSVRTAEYLLPDPAGGAADASVIVYHFGTAAGSVEANLTRWRGQIETEGGSEPEVVAWEHAGFAFHQLDLRGTYVAETSPGSGQRRNDPDQRMIATVIETPAGAYYVKLLGPAATVAYWLPSHEAFLQATG